MSITKHDKFDISQAVKAAPKYDLQGQLAQRTVPTLRNFIKDFDIRVDHRQNKSELIDALATELTSPTVLQGLMFYLTSSQLDFLNEAANDKELHRDEIYYALYGLPHYCCLLTLYFHNDELFCVMPEELRKAYFEIDHASFQAIWQRQELLRIYACAALELYGVIALDELVDIFNAQNDAPTTTDELSEAASKRIGIDPLTIENGHLFRDISFEDTGWNEIKEILAEASKKPRLIPPKEEMLKYGDFTYFHDAPQKEAVEKFMIDTGFGEVDSANFVDELSMMVQSETLQGQGLMNQCGMITQQMSKPQAAHFMELVMDMVNHTRTWRNNGHSPASLREHMGHGKLPAFSSKKVGRNDPCTCSSGRKYKHCCGR